MTLSVTRPGGAGVATLPRLAVWVALAAILVAPILLFLSVAVTPRLFDQGPSWLTFSAFRQVLSGPVLRSCLNSLAVGVAAAAAAAAVGGGVAWLTQRTTLRGRGFTAPLMFALLIAPSYLIALGWERLVEPAGLLTQLGLPTGGLAHLVLSPVGVVTVLAAKGVPFAYLAISPALRGVGQELDDAVRVHGGGRATALRFTFSLVAPAVCSALAIVFAESISDFGVAATLAADAHFPVATFTLYNAIDNYPAQFPVAAAIGWLLLAMAGLALLAQTRALRGRCYQTLGGRSRPARPIRLSWRAQLAGGLMVGLVAAVGIGVPVAGAVSASLIGNHGSLVGHHPLTLAAYRRVLMGGALAGPLGFSAKLAVGAATVTVILGVIVAGMLTDRGRPGGARSADLLLLSAVALPGIVFAAGYIFTYNLPLTNDLGVHLYETSRLLAMAYVATALPSVARLLVGTSGQLQAGVRDAARVHGASAAGAWRRIVLPNLAGPLLWAWLVAFTATLLELPVSELLYPPNDPTVSVAITKALSNYDYSGGTAMEVLALLVAFAVVGTALGAFRLLAPPGWRQLGRGR